MIRTLLLARHPAERGLFLSAGATPLSGRHVLGLGAGEVFEIPTTHLVSLDEVIDLPREKWFTTEGEMVWIYR